MSGSGASGTHVRQGVAGAYPNALVPVFLLVPVLRQSLLDLYGGSREAQVLKSLLSSGPLTLSALCRLCSASERAVRRDGRTGWIRAILLRYWDSGIVVEKDLGNRITYELSTMSSAVALLRELRKVAALEAHL